MQKSARKGLISIIVNATEKLVRPGTMTFQEVVKLAFPNAVFGANKCYTVAWESGAKHQSFGELLESARLKLVEGIEIDVGATDKS